MTKSKLQAARDKISAEFEAAVAPIQKKYEKDMAAAEAEFGQPAKTDDEGVDNGDMMELHGDLPSDEDDAEE